MYYACLQNGRCATCQVRLNGRAAAKICQYLAAWAWELNAKLTGPTSIRASSLYSDDVINVLLSEAEAKWLSSVRSRPLQLIGMCRRTLQKEFKRGTLPQHVHRKLDQDLAELGHNGGPRRPQPLL